MGLRVGKISGRLPGPGLSHSCDKKQQPSKSCAGGNQLIRLQNSGQEPPEIFPKISFFPQ